MILWTVVGGGPCGIAAVGKLIDNNQNVVWIDPDFKSIGRMGKYYRGVLANTPNGSLWETLQSCKSFQVNQYMSDSLNLSHLPPLECSKLHYLVDILEYSSTILRSHPRVTTIQGVVTSMIFTSQWTISMLSQDKIQQFHSDFAILAIGAIPKLPSNIPSTSSSHSVDLMVNSDTVLTIFSQNPELLSLPWAVVGSSHSAMLVIKNLTEVGVQNITNYYRSEFVFEELTTEGWYRNRGRGLKGPVGDWVKYELHKYSNISRIKLVHDTDLAAVISQYENRIIYACGYTRDDTIQITLTSPTHQNNRQLTTDDLNNYNQWTGEIIADCHLYGVGIGFPQLYQHEDGIIEPWVGVRRSLQQIDLILKKELLLLSGEESLKEGSFTIQLI